MGCCLLFVRWVFGDTSVSNSKLTVPTLFNYIDAKHRGAGRHHNLRMNSGESEKIAICCVLLDIVEAMGTSADIESCRHYQSLRGKMNITDSDFERARSVSVLSSLVTLKEMHYNKKMLLALTVCDLYSGYTPVPFNLKITFETLMNAIEWPISFSEILTISRTE